MRKRWLIGACLLMALTGCGQEKTVPAAQEEQTAYWTLDVQGGTVSLREGAAPETLELVLDRDGEEPAVIKTLEDYSLAENVRGWPFEDVLSSDGFVLWTGWSGGGWGISRYYTIEGTRLVQIAESFGMEVQDYSVDLDGDGAKELVSNVVYGGDGHASVFVYQRREDGIWRGWPDWGDLPGHDNWGVNSTWEEYDPEEKVFRVHYTVKDQEEPGVAESAGLDNVTFVPYKEGD